MLDDNIPQALARADDLGPDADPGCGGIGQSSAVTVFNGRTWRRPVFSQLRGRPDADERPGSHRRGGDLAVWGEGRQVWPCTGRRVQPAWILDGVFWAWHKLSCH